MNAIRYLWKPLLLIIALIVGSVLMAGQVSQIEQASAPTITFSAGGSGIYRAQDEPTLRYAIDGERVSLEEFCLYFESNENKFFIEEALEGMCHETSK